MSKVLNEETIMESVKNIRNYCKNQGNCTKCAFFHGREVNNDTVYVCILNDTPSNWELKYTDNSKFNNQR